jgi:hypothetical protein
LIASQQGWHLAVISSLRLIHYLSNVHTCTVKKAMSECTKFRCWQRWGRTKGRGSRNFSTHTSFGSRHRCPHRNIAQLFLQCGLSPSWGTSRICPAWSPPEHQLTPALSPFWGPRPKPRRPEEVVYSPNDSCSHFTQRLLPPKLPQQHRCTILHYTFTLIHTYHTSHSSKQLCPFIYMTNLLFYFFGSS